MIRATFVDVDYRTIWLSDNCIDVYNNILSCAEGT